MDANGMRIVNRRAQCGPYANKGRVDLDSIIRCRGVPEDTINVVSAVKIETVFPPVWPVMSKFKRFPKSHR